MAVKGTDKNLSEIKKLLKESADKIIIGTERALKNLKTGKISAIYVSSNCADLTLEKLEHYAKLSKAKVIKLKYHNDELGVLCKKPFHISVLSVLK